MTNEFSQWILRYALRLVESEGDLSKLSADERKHLRLLLCEYELEQHIVGLQDKLSQGKLELEVTDEKF